MTIREQICAATDALADVRRRHYQQQASYDEAAAAARALLELRQQAEKAFSGRVKTKITPITIAALIR